MSGPSPPHATAAMRDRLLRMRAEELGIVPTPPAAPPDALADVWGCLLELGYPQGPVTLLFLADGTASIYFASGAAVLGTGAHVPVRAAGRAFLETARHVCDALLPTDDLAPPPSGHARFFALTRSGPRSAQAPEDELARGDGPLSVLYHAAQALLTQVRLASRRGGEEGAEH